MSDLWISHSEEDTRRFGASLAEELLPEGILLLSGDLGCGKTVLVKGLAAALGVDPNEIRSPTYTLIHEHEGSRARLAHIDLYRLEPEEVEAIGLDEVLASPRVKAIEWPERLSWTPPSAVHLELVRREDGSREIRRLGGGLGNGGLAPTLHSKPRNVP